MSCGITVRDVQAHLAKIHMLGGARQRFSPKQDAVVLLRAFFRAAGKRLRDLYLDALVVKVREDHILVS